jgi:hypothetical protein
MIISEKQVHDLMMVAHVYLRLLEDIGRQQPEALSECGNTNKRYVAFLLQEITSQQCTKHRVIQ